MTAEDLPIPDEALNRLHAVLSEQGWVSPYRADVNEFTDEQIKAGKLRAADHKAERKNAETLRVAAERIARPVLIAAYRAFSDHAEAEFDDDDEERKTDYARGVLDAAKRARLLADQLESGR